MSAQNSNNISCTSRLNITNRTADHQQWNTTGTDRPQCSDLTGTEIGFLSVSMTILIFGAANNFVFLLVTVKNRTLRSGSGWLIANFFLANMLLSIYSTISIIVINLDPSDSIATTFKVYCPFHMWMIITLGFTNPWTDVCLAVNRFVAICLPHQYHRISSKKVLIAMIAYCWIGSFICGLLVGTGMTAQSIELVAKGCKVIKSNYIGLLSSYYGIYLPYVLIGLVIFGIMAKVISDRFHRFMAGSVVPEGLRGSQERRLKKARMFLAVYMWGIICYIPNILMNNVFFYYLQKYPLVGFSTRILSSCNYAFVPVNILRFRKNNV
jgi:7 transmembrane receptor (rhodopsin family)